MPLQPPSKQVKVFNPVKLSKDIVGTKDNYLARTLVCSSVNDYPACFDVYFIGDVIFPVIRSRKK